MTYKVKLKNSDAFVLLNDFAYNWLSTDPYYAERGLLNNLRLHSSGCAVFQRNQRRPDGSGKVETLYLHKLIAEKYLRHEKSATRQWVGAKNGNKLDCRIENLGYFSRSMLSRPRKSRNRSGYVGVYPEKKRFRAIISIGGKAVHLGVFDTAEEAAAAYQRARRELLKGEIRDDDSSQ